MGIKVKIILIILSLLFVYFILRLLRRNSLRPTFAALWFFLALGMITIPLLEDFYKWISTLFFGMEDARHIIYIGIIGFLLVYNFYLTYIVSVMSNKIQQLISSSSILETTVLKKTKFSSKKTTQKK